MSEQQHPEKVLPEYIQILAMTIRHSLTNREKGFSKIFDSARVLQEGRTHTHVGVPLSALPFPRP